MIVDGTRTASCDRIGDDKEGFKQLGPRSAGWSLEECIDACLNRRQCNYFTLSNQGHCFMFQTCNGRRGKNVAFYRKKCTLSGTKYKCPFGMHKVAPPVRSDDFIVSTADFGEIGPTDYVPGEFMDIHIRSLNPMKKFLGILICNTDMPFRTMGSLALRVVITQTADVM